MDRAAFTKYLERTEPGDKTDGKVGYPNHVLVPGPKEWESMHGILWGAVRRRVAGFVSVSFPCLFK